MEIKFKINFNKIMRQNFFIFALLFVSMISGLFALSPLGGQCSYSRDCIQGYCSENICKVPEVLGDYKVFGSCNITMDCSSGFCLYGQCILPERQEFKVVNLGSGLQSSCAGIIENCTGIWCMFCNITWVLLLIGAAAAAYITRKSGRILPLLLFILPIAAGLIFFPFFGAILAVIVILLIAFFKPLLVKMSVENLIQRIKPSKQPVQPEQQSTIPIKQESEKISEKKEETK